MTEAERHDRYKEAQDKAWAYVLSAEDKLESARKGAVTARKGAVTGDGDRNLMLSNADFTRAQAWATVAVALRRDGPS